jgi:phage tail-like protein
MMSEKPSSTYLQYLPAIHQEDEYLGRFLLPFEETLAGFEQLFSTIDRYFAPARTDRDFLPWLATWVALVLDEEWDEAKRRRLIGEAVELYRWRGTVKGLQDYLEIYTGLVPEIREWRWPGGMQIGVASRIGGKTPMGDPITPIVNMVRAEPVASYDYYVVDTVAQADHPLLPEGDPLRLYYRADRVEKVDVGDGWVDIYRFLPGEEVSTRIHHQPGTVTRRDDLVEDQYTLTIATETGTEEVTYRGDTFLVDEVELPYRFVVEAKVPLAEVEKVKLDKVRAIVDLEKPAHTLYYLKLVPVVSAFELEPMQIGIHSAIGVDTTVG